MESSLTVVDLLQALLSTLEASGGRISATLWYSWTAHGHTGGMCQLPFFANYHHL